MGFQNKKVWMGWVGGVSSIQVYFGFVLKLTFRKYPAIHTNYIISHCITLQYNHNKIMTRYIGLGRKKNLNMKNNEFKSAAIFSVWHELPRLRSGQSNVAGIRRRQET